MSVKRWSPIREQFLDASGNPYVAGELYFYVAGSSTPQDTFTTDLGNIANANPVILDTAGRPSTEIWLTAGLGYKVVLKNSSHVTIWSEDDIYGINDATITLDQWIPYGTTPTYISTTVFTVPGDQTATFAVGTAIKATVTGSPVFSKVKTVAYTSLTTVTLEDAILTSGLSAVATGIFTATNNALPAPFDTNPIAVGSADITKKVRVEADGITTSTTRVWTAADASGIVALTTETNGSIQFSKNWIAGLTYANNAGDATNDIDIAVGECRDSTNAANMLLGSALTKRLDASWVVGTNQGGILSGSAADVDYNIWAIKRVDTGVVDVGMETTANATPTLPSNYTLYRKIGWFKRVGGSIVLFHTYERDGGGIHMAWDSPTLDVDQTNGMSSTARTDALKVPLTFSVMATINVVLTDATGGAAYFSCPDQTDVAASTSAAPLSQIGFGAGIATSAQLRLRTGATGLVRSRATVTVDTYRASTAGFEWSRR